jgi:16S rRNA (guanine527-N7)-methyltransferase
VSAPDEEVFRAALLDALGSALPVPDAAQIDRMFAYHAAVVETNRLFNLTRIVEPAESAVKHFADALGLLGWIEARGVSVKFLLDVGTGAGLPAVPLAIVRPDWSVTAIDSTAKKVRFVAETCARLGLTNVMAEQRRAGEWRPERRFNLVTFKAVGDLSGCVEQSVHLVQHGGHVVVYKTAALSDEERAAGLRVARKARLEVLEPYRYRLCCGAEIFDRTLCIFRKA